MELNLTMLTNDEWHEVVIVQMDAAPDVPVELRVQAAINNGAADAAMDRYFPPRPSDREAFDAYMWAWNTEWAKLNGRTLLR